MQTKTAGAARYGDRAAPAFNYKVQIRQRSLMAADWAVVAAQAPEAVEERRLPLEVVQWEPEQATARLRRPQALPLELPWSLVPGTAGTPATARSTVEDAANNVATEASCPQPRFGTPLRSPGRRPSRPSRDLANGASSSYFLFSSGDPSAAWFETSGRSHRLTPGAFHDCLPGEVFSPYLIGLRLGQNLLDLPDE